jgi:hypothetical protein
VKLNHIYHGDCVDVMRTFPEGGQALEQFINRSIGGMKMNRLRLRYLIHCAWFYWTKGEPMPVDVHNELVTQWLILPESLYDNFKCGLSVDEVVRKLLGGCVDYDDYAYEEGDEEEGEENDKAHDQYEDFVTW